MAVVPFQQYDAGSLFLERALGYEQGMGLVQPVQYSQAGVWTSPALPGGCRGVSFPKLVAGPTGTAGAAAGVMSGAQVLGAIFFVTVPAALTTGLTFIVHGTDDGTNPADLGLIAVFGIQTKVLTAGALTNFGIPNYATTSPFLNQPSGTGINVTGTEAQAQMTLPTVAGGFASATITVVSANMGYQTGLGANSVVMVRLRRIGMATPDTLPGRVVVTGVNVGTY